MSERGGFEFDVREPSGELGKLVESIWFARGTIPYAQELIAPTGSVVAIFILGDPIEQTPLHHKAGRIESAEGLMIGPHDGPIINRPLGETHAVGIVSSPVGCANLFGFSPLEIRGRIVNLSGVWPAASDVRNSLSELGAGGEKTALVEDFLRRRGGAPIPGLARCRAAIAHMESDPKASIASVAKNLNISPGHLDREFSRVVGLSPRTLSNIIRMRILLNDIDIEADMDWSDLAVRYGWFDQAHFIRSFKRHTGCTPSAYVAAQRALAQNTDLDNAAGFVPEF